jgi:nitroreductase
MDFKPGHEVGLFEALYSTRALRRFKPDPVPDELLFQVIDAAIRAPAGGNLQVWRFLVVRDAEKRRRIGEMYWETWTRYGKEYLEDPSRTDALPRQMRLVVRATDDLARHLGEVPVHLFVCGPRGAEGGHGLPGRTERSAGMPRARTRERADRVPSSARGRSAGAAGNPRGPGGLRPPAHRVATRPHRASEPPAGSQGREPGHLGSSLAVCTGPAGGGIPLALDLRAAGSARGGRLTSAPAAAEAWVRGRARAEAIRRWTGDENAFEALASGR